MTPSFPEGMGFLYAFPCTNQLACNPLKVDKTVRKAAMAVRSSTWEKPMSHAFIHGCFRKSMGESMGESAVFALRRKR